MDNFRLIHKILTIHKNALWEEGAPLNELTPEKLGTTDTHVRNIQIVLRNAGLIVGTNGQSIITLAGLEYLDSNPQMVKISSERKPYSY